MVNITVLQRISNLIKKFAGPMKKWSERSRYKRDGDLMRYTKMMVRQIRKIMLLVSGNDIIEMLRDTLTLKEKEGLSLPKYKEALKNLSAYYNKINLKKRHKFVRPIKIATLKFSEIRRLGYRTSKRLWNTCYNKAKRNLGGNKPIPFHVRESIRTFLHENSTPGSNRLVRDKSQMKIRPKKYVSVRYLNENKTELYKKSPFLDIVSKSTFLKYAQLENIYKNPCRLTDLCEYCEKEIDMRKFISKLITDEEIGYQEKYDIGEIKTHIAEKTLDLKRKLSNDASGREPQLKIDFEKYKKIMDELKDYEALIFHKNVARSQRNAYKNCQSIDSLHNKIMIVVDFKQKILIGMSPRQVSGEYYNQKERSCLGFGVYYIDSDGNIKLINFNIISSDTVQDAYSAVRGFRILREQHFFKEIEKNDYIIWCDVGKHFRNNELMAYLMLELAEENIHVNLNFFAEKHGKSCRDTHFSNVSRFIKAESLIRKLNSSADIVEAILKRQQFSNDNKNDSDVHENVYAIALDYETDTRLKEKYPEKKTLTINNIESFYNYRTVGNDFKLATSVLSEINLVKIIQKSKIDARPNDLSIVNEVPIVESSVHFNTIYAKKQRINAALSQIKNSNADIDYLNSNFFNFFSSNIEPEEENIVVREKPMFCRGELERTALKHPCMECDSVCSYTMFDILDLKNGLNQNDLIDELTIHRHPKSRRMPAGHLRRTLEAARELADHYKYAHNMDEPELI